MMTQLKNIFLTVFFSLSFATSALATDTLDHWVGKGKYHKSGWLKITKLQDKSETFQAKIQYKLKPKFGIGTIIKKWLKGTYEFSLPTSMLSEQGYVDLMNRDKSDPMVVANGDKTATVIHKGYVNTSKYHNAHKIEIRSLSTKSSKYPNGKWHINLYYHPSVAGMGVYKSEIRYHGKAGKYNIDSFLIEKK